MHPVKKKIFSFIYYNIIPVISRPFIDHKRIPIIYYHNVVEEGYGFSFMHIGKNAFIKQMEYLKNNGYKTYTFNEIPKGLKKKKQSKEVVITFDDGFLSNYTVVFPILKKLGLKYNVFITAEYVNEEKRDYLSWEMIKEMAESNIVGFGAHTYTHIDSRNIHSLNYPKEISLTNSLISEYTRNEITDFCFPFGYYNKQIINQLSKNNVYKRLYTSDQKKYQSKDSMEIIGRIPISNDYGTEVFEKHLNGLFRLIYYYYAIRGTYTRRNRKKYNGENKRV